MAFSNEDSLQLKNSPHWLQNYLPLWLGQTISLLGSGVVQFALVWHLTKTTGSATVLAMATFVALIPGVFLGPFAGALVDRWNRKRIMIYGDLIVALTTLALVIIFALGIIEVWHIYTALFIRSLAGCFQWPAASASTSMMVPDSQMTRIAGVNQAVNGAIGILSPPLGALLISLIPMFGVLMVDIVTAAIAILLLVLFVTVPQPVNADGASRVSVGSVLEDVRTGFRFAFGWKGLFMVLLGATLINFLFSPGMSLLPLLVTQHFKGDVKELAWLESAFGIGTIVGGVLLGIWGGFKRRMFTMIVGVIGLATGILMLGLASPSQYWLAVGAAVWTGFMGPITNGPFFAIIQSKVPHEIQGKVFAVINSMASAASPIGMLLAAPVANNFGIQAWFVVGGVLTTLLGVWMFFYKPIATLDLQSPGGAIETVEPVPVAVEV